MLQSRIKKFVNYFLGPLLFVIIGLSIYRQILQQDNLKERWYSIVHSVHGEGAWRIYIVIFLMLLNWGIESLKWQVLLSHIIKMKFLQAFRSVVSGLAFTMITPNRMGEFIGRVFYVPEGNRIRAAALTLISSVSQTIVTLFAGAIGLLAMQHYLRQNTADLNGLSIFWIKCLLAGTIFIFCLMLSFYYRIGWLLKVVEKLPPFAKYAYFIQPLQEVEIPELTKILLLSVLRFTVFVCQYWLLLALFDVQMEPWQALSSITVLFLVLAVVPTIALAELGIRTKTSIVLFGIFSGNAIGILVTTAAIWLINIIFPAVAGSLFVLSVKIFRK